MFEEMIQHIVPRLHDDIQGYFDANPGIKNYSNRRGKVGEFLIGRVMKYILLEYGFSWGDQPCSFTIKTHYPKEGVNEIDFRIDIFDSEGRPHIFYVEAKNCMDHYDMTLGRFRRNILNKFLVNALNQEGHHEGLWMVTLNQIHRGQIGHLCMAHGIEIIPIDVILATTETQTTSPPVDELEIVMRTFSQRFIEAVQGHLVDFNCRRPDPRNISENIQMGVPYQDICSKFGLDPIEYRGNYDKIASDMRKEGLIPRPDGRTKAGRVMSKKMKDL